MGVYEEMLAAFDAVNAAEQQLQRELENPLLVVCNPVDTWTALEEVRKARRYVAEAGGWRTPARPMTVCPRRHAPAGHLYVIDPLVGGAVVYDEDVAS